MREHHASIGKPLRIWPSRRFRLLLACVAVFSLFSLFLSRPSIVPGQSTLSRYADRIPFVPKIGIPPSENNLDPVRPPSNTPPRQKNDVDSDGSSWSDWEWLSMPFSTLTLNESHSILPPLEDRAPIYCYYDPANAEDRTTADAEGDLLLTWRRAWWAQGFRPIILSPADAMDNHLYGEVQRLDLIPAVKTEIMRWLAWENVGGGLLSSYTLLPMGPREDAELTFLRRGIYPAKLTRWQGLNDGLLAGSGPDVLAAIEHVLASGERKQFKDFLAAVPAERFHVGDMPNSIVHYGASLIKDKYAKVEQAFKDNRAGGLKSLNLLINSHLHTTWQNLFSDGIAVVKPLPKHSTHMISEARQLAVSLSQCSPSPMVNSCPPNNDQCNPCISSRLMHISTPGRYQNISTLYTIGTVPHPYTTALLSEARVEVDIPWIRRISPRDPWLRATTTGVLGATVSSAIRVVRFKEMVASQYATAHALWLTAEKLIQEDKLRGYLDWHFGFAIPYDQDRGYTDLGPGRRPKPEHDPVDGPVANEADLALEPFLLQKAREIHAPGNIGGEDGKDRAVAVRAAIEAWNLGDTESWKFATAFLVQRIIERLEWEEDETRHHGAARPVGIEDEVSNRVT
ncbi:hypothetical protein ACRALDRAFT_2038421 [Sodiomyces alcalophilus JCM 7366]|uniref:uncharacterized protein n=1 Tax=Sodiomyces alcalophilus JCM 7366 TaxID=591952 RepID=UPI0039B5F7DB